MSESSDRVLQMAVKALLAKAIEHGCDAEKLCESTIEMMLNNEEVPVLDVALAISAIEVAADALDYSGG